MIDAIVFALWFFLPAGLANGSPVVVNKIPFVNQFKTPLDFGKTYKGKRIFGQNKTWRGLIGGVITASLTLLIQVWLFNTSSWLQNNIILIDYSSVSLWLGPLLGAGALLGDAVESFFKRQLNVASGEPWFPFDQIDYIIGGILLSSLVTTLPGYVNVTILLVWFGMHLIWSYIGFLLGLKDKPI